MYVCMYVFVCVCVCVCVRCHLQLRGGLGPASSIEMNQIKSDQIKSDHR